MKNELVVVIDFGSPYNQLLTRSIRELGVYSELLPHTVEAETLKKMEPKAIILSGGPYYVHDENKYRIDEAIYDLGIPVLGICYGAQLLAEQFGGEVVHEAARTYEITDVNIEQNTDMLAHVSTVYASKGDQITRVPADFSIDATFVNGEVATFSNEAKKMYGIQFYPEKTENGKEILKDFLFTVSELEGDWTIESFIDSEVVKIRETVGDRKVLCALSGGVDSTVVAALLHKAIGDQLTCIFVDHGLLRKGEGDMVMEQFGEGFNMNIIRVDAQERFMNKLQGVSDPEQKRKIIGNEFVYVFDDEASKLKGVDFLAQGTLYTDVIESGTKTAQTIKSHHNVGGLPEDMEFQLIEPINTLFKDEVRELGIELGIPEHLVWRQPFPGPGLGIRVLGEITEDKLEIVRESDAILRQVIREEGLERDIWQYFTVLPGIQSVGVMGDYRTYDHTVGIRAVTSIDGMTSDFARIDWEVLQKISSRIVNEVDHVNRVVYDITSKPPSTIEWE